jgi:branched-chain amino acid transport system substrate-binding protein
MKIKGVVVMVCFVVLAGLCGQAQITIGMNVSTTGPGASLGIPAKNALTLAPTVIAGQKVNYVVYDDSSDPTKAVQNVKRLISEDKIDVLLGPSITVTSLAVIDTVSELKTPMFSFGSATAIVSPMDAKRKWVFKIGGNDDLYIAAMMRNMVRKGVKTASLIATDDPFGESNTAEFKRQAEKKGIRVLGVEKFQKGDTSVTPQVLRLVKENPDAIYIIAVSTTAALPNYTLVGRGYKGRIYHTGSVANAEFLRVGGKSLEGVFVTQAPVFVYDQLPEGYPTKAEAAMFAQAYEPKFGLRSVFAAQVWDSINILKLAIPQALKVAKPGTVEFREALRTAIENTKDYKGTMAVFNFTPTDHTGVDEVGMAVIRVENGGWKLEDHADYKKN